MREIKKVSSPRKEEVEGSNGDACCGRQLKLEKMSKIAIMTIIFARNFTSLKSSGEGGIKLS